MKLYEVPRGSLIKIISGATTPVYDSEAKEKEILKFNNMDGMYSNCERINGEIIHLVAWTEVEIVDV